MKFVNDPNNLNTGSIAPSSSLDCISNTQGIQYVIDRKMQFPLVNINLQEGCKVFVQPGSMVYHSNGVKLTAHLNGDGNGLHKFMSAIGRSFTSGEDMMITQAVADSDGTIALAPEVPGDIKALNLGRYQYKISDKKFLAMDGNCSYTMERQSIGKAFFAGNGGFYVMTTQGTGTVLINSYGSIRKIELNNGSITIDNYHVVAWSTSLDYNIHTENGYWQSIGTGEGIVNTFTGTGEVYIQSLNLDSLAQNLKPLLPSK